MPEAQKNFFSTVNTSLSRVECLYCNVLTYSPDVHWRSVLSVAHQELGGSVPSGGHVVRVVLPGTDHPGEPEVTKLHHSVLGDQDVLRLDVPVQAVVEVTEIDGLQGLPGDALQERQPQMSDKLRQSIVRLQPAIHCSCRLESQFRQQIYNCL